MAPQPSLRITGRRLVTATPGLAAAPVQRYFRAVDGYIAGQGLLHASLQAVLTLVKLRGEGEIARSELAFQVQ
jgi:hypothetical protein